MPLWKIAWRSVQRRALASSLTAASLALGVMLVVAILLIHGIVSESFRNNSSLGYNLIAGAKGGKLQLVLNTVYYLSTPVENIPYSFYEEFLPAERRGDGVAGQYAASVARVIPLCLGDYFQSFRVVGTNSDMFNDYVYDEETGKKFEFSSGRNFQEWDDQHGYFEAIVGARVARAANLKVGDRINPTHGSEEGKKHDEFTVVGILAPSGTPHDRAVFVNMEGFYLLEGHAKPVKDAAADTGSAVAAESSDPHGDHEAAGESSAGPSRKKLPLEQREVTALLIRTSHPAVAPGLLTTINEGQQAQAVLPIREITGLFELIVAPIQMVFVGVTLLICVVSGVSILVSIYNSMSDRRHEIAIMRSLGASRTTVMVVVLLEAMILAVGGGLVGWLGGHALIGLAARTIEDRTGVVVSPFELAPAENVLQLLGGSPLLGSEHQFLVSPELLLVPFLVILAIVVGFLPALSAYQTDVAKSLSATP